MSQIDSGVRRTSPPYRPFNSNSRVAETLSFQTIKARQNDLIEPLWAALSAGFNLVFSRRVNWVPACQGIAFRLLEIGPARWLNQGGGAKCVAAVFIVERPF